MPVSTRQICFGVFGLFLLVAIFLGWRHFSRPAKPPEKLLTTARTLLHEKRFEEALRHACLLTEHATLRSPALLVAGECAIELEDFSAAKKYFSGVPPNSPEFPTALFSLAEIARDEGQLTKSVELLKTVLELEPQNQAVHERLAFLNTACGNHWKSQVHYRAMLNAHPKLSEMTILGDLERPVAVEEFLDGCLANSPNDVLALAGKSLVARHHGHAEEARSLCWKVVERNPEMASAQARLGELLLNSPQEFAEWYRKLPPSVDSNADIWLVRGLYARQHNELKVAAKLFLRATMLQPSHRRATYQLGQVLGMLGHPARDSFSERATLLFDLTLSLDIALERKGHDETSVRKVVGLLEKAGRYEEAVGWSRWALQKYGTFWPSAVIQRCLPLVDPAGKLTADSANLALRYSFDDFPDHDALFDKWLQNTALDPTDNETGTIRFDLVDSVGVDFEYSNGDNPEFPGVRMLEQTGGGVAVLDFDRDSQPDLFFPQGSNSWREGEKNPAVAIAVHDQLFRNREGKFFVNVTAASGLVDAEFGQGCTVLDFDNDGFDDIYVANAGRNQLLKNNGDGTFLDVTEAAQIDAFAWTTSCAGVDLNNDGLPDLIDVNYLKGEEVFTLICGNSCSPSNFDGAEDVVYLNQGDNTFQRFDLAQFKDAKGIGLAVFRLADELIPSVFVANDQVPNFFYRLSGNSTDFKIRNENFLTGLAMNDAGLAMACMGVAADDIDNDGDIDLFVSNFEDETNTLYLQDKSGLFVDSTESSGLAADCMPYVGWGTQFLDADLDGNIDVVVANGHFNQNRPSGKEYRMPTLIYQNYGQIQFRRLSPAVAGDYFGKKYLGRGLATLDWNQDGLPEFVVSNMNQPISLLKNVSPQHGSFVNVRLHATEGARDAFGTRVTVRIAGRTYHKQLVAGNGFMAHNERVLNFGLGAVESTSSVELEFVWPDGSRSKIQNVAVNSTLDVVQNGGTTIWSDGTPRAFQNTASEESITK